MAPYLSCYFSKFLTFLGNIPYYKWNHRFFINHSLVNFNSVLDKCILPRYLGSSSLLCSEKKFAPIGKKGIERYDGTMIKVKTKIIPQITLLDQNGGISVVTMDSARKLAEHRNLKLVDVTHEHEGSERRVFRLSTGTENFSRKDQSNKGKSKKLLTINTSIAEHDLNTKIKLIKKSAFKDHSVKVNLIDDSGKNNLKEVYSYMENNLKDVCKCLNKAIQGNKLSFNVEVIKELKNSVKDSEDKNKRTKEIKVNSEALENMDVK